MWPACYIQNRFFLKHIIHFQIWLCCVIDAVIIYISQNPPKILSMQWTLLYTCRPIKKNYSLNVFCFIIIHFLVLFSFPNNHIISRWRWRPSHNYNCIYFDYVRWCDVPEIKRQHNVCKILRTTASILSFSFFTFYGTLNYFTIVWESIRYKVHIKHYMNTYV